jgi:hypothetical protein
MALLLIAAVIRSTGIETQNEEATSPLSSTILDTGLSLMAADIIVFWT